MSSRALKWSIYGIALVIFTQFVLSRTRIPNIQEHLLHHEVHFVPELLSEDDAEYILNLAKEMADFPSNNQDIEFYDTVHEHIGEATPILPDGTCDNPFLVPSKNKTECVLPGRIDLARHYMMYGGIDGVRENHNIALSRIQSFGRYIFSLDNHEGIKKLFESERFRKESLKVCPPEKQVVDPFQFNMITQVPGQAVPLHLDAVYFEDATRFQFPQWFLAVMQSSGLFRQTSIDQIQAVAYYHPWNITDRGGEFIYYTSNDEEPYSEKPMRRAGSFVDGSKVIHGATVYQPTKRPPFLDTAKNNRLVYKGDDIWIVTSDGQEVARYTTNDLRMTLVFRARCFATEEKRAEFLNSYRTREDFIPLEDILEKFKMDLVEHKGYEKEYLDDIGRFELAMTLLDEYIMYPIPARNIIPYNYCSLSRLYPSLLPILNLVC